MVLGVQMGYTQCCSVTAGLLLVGELFDLPVSFTLKPCPVEFCLMA